MDINSEPLPSVPYEHQRALTDDGVDLAFQTTGDGPCVLLANGIGVTSHGMGFLAKHLSTYCKVVLWDYRGAGKSILSPSIRKDLSFSIQRHARDAFCVLDKLGVGKAVVLGWSLGVPVGLEMIRHAEERVAGFGALFGAPGLPFRKAFRRPLSDLVHLFFKAAHAFPWPAQTALDLAAAVPSVAWRLSSAVEFVGGHAHRQTYLKDVESVAGTDKHAYFGTMLELMRHDASDLLPRIRCPVLVAAGKRDWVTPPEAAEAMVEAIPGARLLVLDNATHFGIIEYREELWTHIDELIHAAFGTRDP